MATPRICSIPDCTKPAITRGLCLMHYTRVLTHGDPNKRLVRRGDARKFLHEVAIPYEGDDCLIWPFAKTKGYGWIKHLGKGAYVHRVVCELVHGTPPNPNDVTRHSCGNGHLACCNPKHLSWGTAQANSDDCLSHGTRARGERQGSSKLTSEQVLEILSAKANAKALAKTYGVSRSQIDRIRTGRQWAWISSS